MLTRILIGALFGGLIGIEREVHGCAAGLRTHILVCIGSTLFMMTSINVAAGYSHLGAVDPSRIASGVVTGIGFLGAGAIIRYGTSVRGLTTAASIWAVSAVGLAVGAGMYNAAGITTAVSLAVLILSRLEEHWVMRRGGKTLKVKLSSEGAVGTDEIDGVIEAYGGKVKVQSSRELEGQDQVEVILEVKLSRLYYKDMIAGLRDLPGVEDVRW